MDDRSGSNNHPADSGSDRARTTGTTSCPVPGSPAALQSIVSELGRAPVPSDLPRRRGHQAEAWWRSITATPLYEALTVWVMAAWPDAPLEATDTMVRAIVGHVPRVARGEWTIAHLIGVAHRAGRHEPRPVHRIDGRRVRVVGLDQQRFELTDEVAVRPASSIGPAALDHLRRALGTHAYLVTPPAAALIDASADIAVDHLNAIYARSCTAAHPDGTSGLALLAAARPTKAVPKANRLTALFSDLEHHCAVDLSRLLLGTDRHPTAALLWRTLVGCNPEATPPHVVASWRAELPSLTPMLAGESDRRRRRLRDRCRHGEDVRRAFEAAEREQVRATTEPPVP